MDPKVAFTGMVSSMSVGTPTWLSTKEHRMTSEFTLDPKGVKVFKVDALAVFTDGKVPALNPIRFPKLLLVTMSCGHKEVVWYPTQLEGAVQPDGKDVGTKFVMSWTP